jgi:hypothetical protein
MKLLQDAVKEATARGILVAVAPLLERLREAVDAAASAAVAGQFYGDRWPQAYSRLNRSIGALFCYLPPKADAAAKSKLAPVATDYGYFAPAQLAEQYGIDTETARKALGRWRHENVFGDGYIENPDRRPNEPRFLYERRAVAAILEAAKDRATRRKIRRTKTSGGRPAQ